MRTCLGPFATRPHGGRRRGGPDSIDRSILLERTRLTAPVQARSPYEVRQSLCEPQGRISFHRVWAAAITDWLATLQARHMRVQLPAPATPPCLTPYRGRSQSLPRPDWRPIRFRASAVACSYDDSSRRRAFHRQEDGDGLHGVVGRGEQCVMGYGSRTTPACQPLLSLQSLTELSQARGGPGGAMTPSWIIAGRSSRVAQCSTSRPFSTRNQCV